MRQIAWLLIIIGLVIAVGAFPYANQATLTNIDAEIEVARRSLDIVRIARLLRMLDEGKAPASAVVSPWPGILVGGGLFALGMIILAIRKP